MPKCGTAMLRNGRFRDILGVLWTRHHFAMVPEQRKRGWFLSPSPFQKGLGCGGSKTYEGRTLVALPYYPLYPKDFDTDEAVRSMTDADLGLFLRCLNHAWTNNGLPADIGSINRLMRTDAFERIAGSFPVAEDGRRRNHRQEVERRKAEEKVDHGRKGARARWNDARALPEQCPPDARGMPRAYESVSDSLKKESGEKNGVLSLPLRARQDEWFNQRFWIWYWRKVDRAAALKAYRKHATTEALAEKIEDAVKSHSKYYLQRDSEFQPHASTWLNKLRWQEPSPGDVERDAPLPPPEVPAWRKELLARPLEEN